MFEKRIELLKEYEPKHRMFTSPAEIDYISEVLELRNLNREELTTLRNEVVEFFTKKLEETENISFMKGMQSITAVIDLWKRNYGEV